MADKKFQPKLSNTNQEMLNAYTELVQQLQERRETELKPEEKVEEKVRKQAVEVADALSTEGITQAASTLKSESGKLLGQLSDRLEEEIGKYRQVKRAVDESAGASGETLPAIGESLRPSSGDCGESRRGDLPFSILNQAAAARRRANAEAVAGNEIIRWETPPRPGGVVASSEEETAPKQPEMED